MAAALLLAWCAAPARAQLSAQLVVSGLSAPLAFVQDPSQSNVQMVVEQGGRIRVVQNGVLLPTDFLDLTAVTLHNGEQGLLGLAFPPDYASSRRLYVNFINKQGDTVIARFLRMASNSLQADPASRFDLVWPGGLPIIVQPFANHNGGNLIFGPDGFLYIGMGDGGSSNDPLHLAQSPASLLGKMLRIDVTSVALSHPTGYVVPPSNPFVGQPGVLGEIWAFGYRNPWRWSFDDPSRGGTGAMIVGDVGQGSFEEIDYEPAGKGGRNYGWRNREGAHDNVVTLPPFSTPLTDPIFEYARGEGHSVTGGFVYRGGALGSAYVGKYFFADIIFSRVWSLGLSINSATGEATAVSLTEHTAELGGAATAISSFGVDANGELYVVGHFTGEIHRIVPGVTGPPTGAACTTPQPDVTWTCVNGDWLPPGFPGTTPPSTPTPPPSSPPPSNSCTTPAPASDWTCVNGDWLPPGFPGTTPPPTPPTPPPTTPPPTSPPPATGCTTPQPASDWTCANGNWYPPGMPIPGGAPPSTPPPTTPPPPTSCPGTDPFFGLPGLVGVCVNGDWIPTELLQTAATVRFHALEGGFWALDLDDGRFFVPLGGLPVAFQVEGRRVNFTGKVRTDMLSVQGPIVELLSIQ